MTGDRELAARESDRLRVRLFWQAEENALAVSIDDSSSGHLFEFGVPRDRGLDAFYHPFAYAASAKRRRRDGERHICVLSQQV